MGSARTGARQGRYRPVLKQLAIVQQVWLLLLFFFPKEVANPTAVQPRDTKKDFRLEDGRSQSFLNLGESNARALPQVVGAVFRELDG